MKLDPRRLYRAMASRDSRFDGLFFVGVTSTHIYCRPVCPVKTPRAANCRFFRSTHEAEQSGFRPCLRCRPELAPGLAPIDDAERIAQAIVQRVEDGSVDDGVDLESVAAQFQLSSRQIRRIVRQELGVAPMQLLLTRRLLLAKQLLTETALPMVDVAFASGFSSVRRFNDAFGRRYGMPPSRLRQSMRTNAETSALVGTSTLQVAYRPPYDWHGVLRFLEARALAGVERVMEDAYVRSVQLGKERGWIRVRPSAARHHLTVEFTHGLAPVLPALLRRVRALFDLDARPDVIATQLRKDSRLRDGVRSTPGLRVPGAFSGFETGLRAILGQQVTVKAATTLAGRIVHAFGEPATTPFPDVNRYSPTPATLAAASVDDIAGHGVIAARARSLIALASAVQSGTIDLDRGQYQQLDDVTRRLTAIPGIGPWTSEYIAMRALGAPDAFPREDVAIRKALGGVSPQEAERQSQAWRPWRSYAVLHLWRAAARREPSVVVRRLQA